MTKLGIVWLVTMWILVTVIISCKNSVPEESNFSTSKDFNNLEALESKWKEENPCKSLQDYMDKPKECSVHYLEGDPKNEAVVYLAEDGTVRWMSWKKGAVK